jgi:hypothetical protein
VKSEMGEMKRWNLMVKSKEEIVKRKAKAAVDS